MIQTVFSALCLALLGGCGDMSSVFKGPSQDLSTFEAGTIPLPSPIDTLLPARLRVHPFSAIKMLDAKSGYGLDVRVEALDAFDDTTKAFGSFRFELYSYIAGTTDPKGGRLITWEVPLGDPKVNMVHWQKMDRNYRFRLQWGGGVAPGQRYVLVVIYTSPYTKRIEVEHQLVVNK
ncbi:MAG: hypothetical protein LLG01_01040 [Planctomycetaceae bacterium]|nr:hypothetical protein [Planctomycetaceae bacterium]